LKKLILAPYLEVPTLVLQQQYSLVAFIVNGANITVSTVHACAYPGCDWSVRRKLLGLSFYPKSSKTMPQIL
jgi:hypothetical protein